jgi:hypothetical protein
MNCAFELGSGAMIYAPSAINIGSVIQKLVAGNSQAEQGDPASVILFFFSKIMNVG